MFFSFCIQRFLLKLNCTSRTSHKNEKTHAWPYTHTHLHTPVINTPLFRETRIWHAHVAAISLRSVPHCASQNMFRAMPQIRLDWRASIIRYHTLGLYSIIIICPMKTLRGVKRAGEKRPRGELLPLPPNKGTRPFLQWCEQYLEIAGLVYRSVVGRRARNTDEQVRGGVHRNFGKTVSKRISWNIYKKHF